MISPYYRIIQNIYNVNNVIYKIFDITIKMCNNYYVFIKIKVKWGREYVYKKCKKRSFHLVVRYRKERLQKYNTIIIKL